MSEYSLHIRYKKIVDYAEFCVFWYPELFLVKKNGAFFFILNYSFTNTLLDENPV